MNTTSDILLIPMENTSTSPVLDDKTVIKSVIGGQKDDFEFLVNKYYRQILVYLCRLLNYDQGDAQDILQETFVKAFVNLVNYNPALSFSSWLYRIAHNLAIDLIRKKSKHYSIDTNDEIFQNHIHSNQTVISKLDESQNNFAKLDRLESILNKLDIETRNILTLFYLQGLSLIEISDILKTTPNTIATRLKRAREKAKTIILRLKL
jgi:RNA polymerase sigma-70 factor, ECF subfamily